MIHNIKGHLDTILTTKKEDFIVVIKDARGFYSAKTNLNLQF